MNHQLLIGKRLKARENIYYPFLVTEGLIYDIEDILPDGILILDDEGEEHHILFEDILDDFILVTGDYSS